MEKFNIYIRYTIETKVTVEADSEIDAMKQADMICDIQYKVQNPEGSKVIERTHRTIYGTEKVKK